VWLKKWFKVLKMIILYTGDGKGKTTAALGAAIRALGYGERVIIIQFLKSWKTGETLFLEELKKKNKNIEYYHFGSKEFITKKQNIKEARRTSKNVRLINKGDKEKAEKALELFIKKTRQTKQTRKEQQKPFLIVLDEINLTIHFKLLNKRSVLKAIKQASKQGINIILTGRYAPKEFYEIADLITEMKSKKHPFDKGILAKKGIDF